MEAGTYPAICYGLVDLGEQYSETYDKWSPKILILFEIPGETLEINGEEVSRTMSKSYTMSLNEKAARARIWPAGADGILRRRNSKALTCATF